VLPIIAAMLEPGSVAPAFALPDQEGNTVALPDLRGRWVVLYFYPKDDTPGCTVEACEFTAAKAAFADLDAVVLGCSADSAAAHQKFIAKHRLGITLLTDADRKVMQAYGAWGKKVLYGKETVGVIRSTVLVAPDGRIAHRWAGVKAAGHAEHVRARLAQLQGGEATPAKAKPAVKKAVAGRAGKAKRE
jgi:peroxiredoxin Q/BCP